MVPVAVTAYSPGGVGGNNYDKNTVVNRNPPGPEVLGVGPIWANNFYGFGPGG